MQSKKSIILLGVVLVAVIGTGVSVLSFDVDDTQSTSKTKISDVIPNAILGGNTGSWRTINIADVKDDIDYTIEGTVLEFGQPIEVTDMHNIGSAAIPVVISVDKLHKGIWSESTFTFYLTAAVTLNSSQITKNMSYIEILENHETMYAGQDYSDVEKTYLILNHHDLFEIGDKLIIHIQAEQLEKINYIYEKDQGSLEPYYVLILGPYAYYEIIDGLGFNEKYLDGISINSIQVESLP